ncbi:MAG TPA: DUF2254 domain-containing protein [Acidimicrobiia bacterium]|nr:DUF2254 domain-containing protein [Acidimicrobiia bacterium]
MITSIYERIRDSLFLVPITLIIGLGLLAWGARWIDGVVPADSSWLLPTTVDSTRSILSTVATATVTVAGVVFSMTAVVVQLATSQLSPRVTQGLLRDRYQQVTIGMSVGTFVYSLLVLSDVHGTEEIPFSRHDFSATLAVALGVISMVLIVYFIDRVMRSMRIDTIIRRLADETVASINALPDREVPSAEGLTPPADDPGSLVYVAKSGWVGSIDVDRMAAALPPDSVVRVDLRIGDFITRDEVAARVWPQADEKAAAAIAAAIDVNRTRTISTDPSYGIRQLVDVALRALSPSMNDATTGADVIRHLGAPMQRLLMRDIPGRIHNGENGTRIYLPRAWSHSDYVHAAFRELRINAAGEPHALHALIETLASLIGVVEGADFEGRTAALKSEAAEVISSIERSDLAEVDKKYLLDFARRVGLPESTADT